jgi:CheY-like chemotaxis protein
MTGKGLGIVTDAKGEVNTLDARTKAIDRLQKVCSELAELHADLKESDIEATALLFIRDTVDQMRMTAMTLQQGLEWLQLAQDKHGLLALLIDERMRRASQLNTDISKDFEAGRIRTDQEGPSAYLLVLNTVMEQVDLTLDSRKTERQARRRMTRTLLLSKTVLLVDDFDILRKMILDFLVSLDIQVLEAANAAEAIHTAQSHPGTIDLLLTDVEMPGMSGWESANKIAGLKPGIRILYMSAGISLEEWNDYEEKPPGTYFIQKPFHLEELKALLIAIFSE